MSIPGLPRGKRSQVFRGVEAILKADPVLAQVVKTWVSFDGSADASTTAPDLPPSSVEPPFPDLCPYVALALVPQRFQRADEVTYDLPTAIGITVATAGEYADDQFDLQEAIVAAMAQFKTYLDTTVGNFLRNGAVPGQAGCSNWYFDSFAIDPPKDEPAMLVGRGAFLFTVRVAC